MLVWAKGPPARAGTCPSPGAKHSGLNPNACSRVCEQAPVASPHQRQLPQLLPARGVRQQQLLQRQHVGHREEQRPRRWVRGVFGGGEVIREEETCRHCEQHAARVIRTAMGSQ